MKNQLKWIIPFCCLAVLLLIGGECLIGLVWNLGMTASRIWLIFVIVATCVGSIWLGLRKERKQKNQEGD